MLSLPKRLLGRFFEIYLLPLLLVCRMEVRETSQ